MKRFRAWFAICGLFLLLPAVFAQFIYHTNGNVITLTTYDCSGGAVTISNFVTSIGGGSFFGCAKLTSLIIPTSVMSIQSDAFYGCTSLTNVTISNGVTGIEGGAFYGCTNLTNVTIPNSVTNIGNDAFYECGLTNVSIGNGVTSIGSGAFQNCTNLTSVVIPNSVTNIGGGFGSGAFQSCTRLASVTLSNSATSIGEGMFAYCTSLTNVTIPNNITNIGSFAFQNCSNLNSVFFTGNAPSAVGAVFSQDTATIYYLPGTTGWSSPFSSRPAVLWNPQVQTTNGNFGVQTNKFGFTITGTANIPIVVQASTDLTGGAWTAVQSCTLTNGSIYFTDPAWANYPSRFYSIAFP